MAVRLDTEIRREQIISAALGLIGEKGLRNLRMPDIAQKVDLVPSALYRHFSGKQELVLAIVDSIRASLEKHLARSGEETPDPLERLEFIMDEHLKMIGGSPGM
ncbi:MAG: TetR/AcrR family transcriptional regulator, partial [Synergistaceae bacterium]|nr:TetR/AcrR family transcriptional regulator [Synergistaceae bacterium]